ncbi:MAG TPA: hypothetical protein VI911_08030 [Patescibacteria group bacterium]|nr:hypothetical protein [Patescibacteria group bacterium]
MALNITINGFSYLEDATLSGATIKYQAYFYNNGTASSASTWNDVRICESTSYWSFNLGDQAFLGQEGAALNNAKVIIVFWKGTTTDRNADCSLLEQWSATEITLDGSSVYTLDIQVKSNIAPNLVWSLPTTGLVNTNYTTTNTSYDVHSWDFNGVTMNHWRTRYGENIQLVNTITNTDYFWGDTASTLDLSGVASSTHQWATAGIYNVDINIEDECATVTSDTKSIQILYHAPVPAITCHQAVSGVVLDPNTPVTFEYTGTDVDNRIISIDWAIIDTGAFGSTTTLVSANRDDVISHTEGLGTSWYGQSNVLGAFTNPGTHTISIDIHWNDYFEDHVISYSIPIEQGLFGGPLVDFTQFPAQVTVAEEAQFLNTTTSYDRVGTYTPNGYRYTWIYNEDGDLTTATNVTHDYVFEYTPQIDSGIVTLTAYWNDGWYNQTTTISYDVVFTTNVTITTVECYYLLEITGTSSDGTTTGYHWEVYKDNEGSWELTWESPVGLEQKEKKVCFTSLGSYRIIGYVHGTGTTTNDSLLQEIDVVCPTEAYYYIWNGTGVADIGGDWLHSGFGVESPDAMKSGTNGLDASGMLTNSSFSFIRIGPPISTEEYDLIAVQLNLQEWSAAADIEVTLKSVGSINGNAVSLRHYLNSSLIEEWQRIYIPFDSFNMTEVYIDEIEFKATRPLSIYLDDVIMGIGSVITRVVAVKDPETHAHEVGEKSTQAIEIKPSMRVQKTNVVFPWPTNL